MPLSAKDRVEKTEAKYSPYCNMLRAKHLHYPTIRHFAESVFQDFRADWISSVVSIEAGLSWGQRGVLSDLVRRLIKVGDVTLQDFLDAGLPLPAWVLTEYWEIETENLFEICAYPSSKIFTTISYEPRIDTGIFTGMLRALINPTQQSDFSDSLALPTVDRCFIIKSLVCAHNTRNTLQRIFAPPQIGYTTYFLKPSLSSNSATTSINDIDGSFLTLKSNQNPYNQTPTLESSVEVS